MGSATQGEKAALVKELREEGYALKYLLAAMELSKSTYYYEIGKTDKIQERNADISSKIESIFQEYGVRRVYRELARRGFPVNHKRVQRIMKLSLTIFLSARIWSRSRICFIRHLNAFPL